MIKPTDGAHWYSIDGHPMHEVERADGSGMRKTTLADARKRHLVPSVTTVMGIKAKPQLQYWKINQYVQAAIELGTDDLAAIQEYADAKMSIAPDTGTLYHATIEEYLQWRSGSIDQFEVAEPVDANTIAELGRWCDEHDVEPEWLELPFCSSLGYGGTIDFVGYVDGRFALIDWKTQDTAHKNGARFWPGFAVQLAAYARALEWRLEDGGDVVEPDCVSVVVSRDEPLVEHHWWSDDDLERGWREFELCYELWCLTNKYDPREVEE